jgi:hypothetical protein
MPLSYPRGAPRVDIPRMKDIEVHRKVPMQLT